MGERKNLAAELHGQYGAVANALPGQRNQHLELHSELPPPVKLLKLKFTARVVRVGNFNSLAINLAIFPYFLSFFFFFLFAFGVGGGVECVDGVGSAGKRGRGREEEGYREVVVTEL